jgi:hypothetical protein
MKALCLLADVRNSDFLTFALKPFSIVLHLLACIVGLFLHCSFSSSIRIVVIACPFLTARLCTA